MTIKRSELTKIPYIDSNNLGDRVISTLIFFEEGEWNIWVPSPTGLLRMRGRPVEADYFARKPEKDTDIYLEFLNFMTQRACWMNAMPFIDGIRNDIHNLGASLGKLDLFHRSTEDKPISVTRFASTEIEYIFGVCRSLFDLLQEIIAVICLKIDFRNKSNKMKNLPKSFSKMVLNGKKLKSLENIQTQYHLPEELALFYQRHGPFFQVLRQYRDDVVHSGRDFKSIFVTEKGFAVKADEMPFASFGVWTEDHMLPQSLASLRPIVAHVITETICACEDFTQVIQKIVHFPPEIAPKFNLYIRGYHNRQLLAMKGVLEKCLWWE